MSTDAARTKLRELIATKQQWLRQWQAPELLSPGRSDMIQVLSDNIAELQQVLAELDKAEPEQAEPDSPERRCGGPGCDGTCCQPVQEPVVSAGLGPLPEPAQPAEPEGYMPGCLWPLPATPDYYTAEQMREYALRALAKPVQEPIGYLWPTGRHPEFRFTQQKRDGIDGTPVYTSPLQRKPLTEEEIQAAWDSVDMRHPRGNETRIAFARAVERAHGIGGEG